MKIYSTLVFLLLFTASIFAQEQLTNIPTFYITTDGNAEIGSKEDYVKGRIIIKSSVPSECLDMVTEIRGRGNSTWNMAKKPYRIKLEKKTKLLNLPAKEKSWTLLANYADKTLIRNAVAFKIGELVGLEFSPSVRFADVVLNGNYLGNYFISDQVEVAPFRVPVETDVKGVAYPQDGSLGFLIELDGFANLRDPECFRTSKDVKVSIKYPKDEELTDKKAEVIAFTQNFENILFSINFDDPTEGYRKYVDEESLVNWYIACELTGNSDAFWSTYIYKKRGGEKFFFGPLWDFDIAFNNDNRLGDAANKLMRDSAHEPKTWIKQIWNDDWFKIAVNKRWKELVDDEKIVEKLLSYIDQLSTEINLSQVKNFEKWNNLNQQVYYEQFLFPTYSLGVDFLKNYIQQRTVFLTNSFSQVPSQPFVPEDYYYVIENKQTGKVIDVNQAADPNKNLFTTAYSQDKQSQMWRFEDLGKGNYLMINKNTGLAAACTGKSGDAIVQKTINKNDKNQQWKIVPVQVDDYYAMQSTSSNNYFDGGGANVVEWTNSPIDKPQRQWKLKPMAPITGISPIKKENLNILVYPNPATDIVSFNIPADEQKLATFEINSIDGKCIYKNTSDENLQISMKEQNINAGTYFIRIKTKTNNYISKLIVK